MSIDNCPGMSLSDFENIPDGETIFNHGASECVALANQFNEGVLGGGFVQVGAAKDWWFNENVASVHGFERITENPQHGDLFIASGDIYDNQFGHIGYVVRGWDGNTFGTIEQNAGRANAVSRHNRTMANVDGFLRTVRQDIVNPAPAPQPTPEPAPAGTREYVVQVDDNLSMICETQLGDGNRWPEIYELNKATIDAANGGAGPDLIYPGQVILLPA